MGFIGLCWSAFVLWICFSISPLFGLCVFILGCILLALRAIDKSNQEQAKIAEQRRADEAERLAEKEEADELKIKELLWELEDCYINGFDEARLNFKNMTLSIAIDLSFYKTATDRYSIRNVGGVWEWALIDSDLRHVKNGVLDRKSFIEDNRRGIEPGLSQNSPNFLESFNKEMSEVLDKVEADMKFHAVPEFNGLLSNLTRCYAEHLSKKEELLLKISLLKK